MSQGETVEEAAENIQDAFRESVLYYRSAGQHVPWGEVSAADGARECRVLVRF